MGGGVIAGNNHPEENVTKPKCMQRATAVLIKEDCDAEATHQIEGYFLKPVADSNGRRMCDMLFCDEHAAMYNRLHFTKLAKPIGGEL